MKQPRKPLTFDLDTIEADLRGHASPPAAQLPAERQQLGVRIDKGIYKRLRTKAIADEVLVQDVVERAVRELLEREGG